jgi:hypothetical protein
MLRTLFVLSMLSICLVVQAAAANAAEGEATDLPLLFSEDFEDGASRWRPTDDKAWKVKKTDTDHGQVYSQFKKKSDYNPPHRSPFNISLLKDVVVGDFVLDVDVLSTHPDYGHRDAVIVFGYQDPAHFYYVHLGKKADDHANQIFIVNDAPRTKISLTSTDGTDWDDQWHHVRIRRRTNSGLIEIYFDNMDKPVMTAKDKHFLWGQIGLGTFDDTSDWDNLRLRGVKVAKP